MFGSSTTPFGTGSGFGTGTSKFFFLHISNQSVYKMILTSHDQRSTCNTRQCLLHNFHFSLLSFKSENTICHGFCMIAFKYGFSTVVYLFVIAKNRVTFITRPSLDFHHGCCQCSLRPMVRSFQARSFHLTVRSFNNIYC